MLFPVFNKLYFILWPLGSIFLHINSNSAFPTTRTICSWILALHKCLSPRVTGSWGSTESPSLSFKHQIMVSRAALLGHQQICCCSGLNCTCQQENCWWSRDWQSPSIPLLTVLFKWVNRWWEPAPWDVKQSLQVNTRITEKILPILSHTIRVQVPWMSSCNSGSQRFLRLWPLLAQSMKHPNGGQGLSHMANYSHRQKTLLWLPDISFSAAFNPSFIEGICMFLNISH